MKKIILYSKVAYDGIGDYFHLEDIYKYLKGHPKFQHIEFVIILDLQLIDGKPHPQQDKIVERAKSLNVPFHVDLGIEELENQLEGADLIANISFCFTGGLGTKIRQELLQKLSERNSSDVRSPTEKFASLDAKCEAYYYKMIQISEHESGGYNFHTREYPIQFNVAERIFSLGLGNDCCGIKVDDISPATQTNAWNTLVEQDPNFASNLLQSTHSEDFDSFTNNHYFIPAYFSISKDFLKFLRLTTSHASYSDKDFVIYHSGANLADANVLTGKPGDYLINFKEKLIDEFAGTDVKTIKIITPDAKEEVFDTGLDKGRTITIFSGFRVNYDAYNALFHLSSMVAVSGDTSFEKSVSMRKLPCYWSTNLPNIKHPTLEALREISQLEKMPISEEAKRSFNIYFDHLCITKYLRGSESESKEALQKLCEVNFPAMIEAWPMIANFLKMNRNFYDLIPCIFSPTLNISENKSSLFTHPENASRHPIPNSQRKDVFPTVDDLRAKNDLRGHE